MRDRDNIPLQHLQELAKIKQSNITLTVPSNIYSLLFINEMKRWNFALDEKRKAPWSSKQSHNHKHSINITKLDAECIH